MHDKLFLASLLFHLCFLGIPADEKPAKPPIKDISPEVTKLDGIYFCKGKDLNGKEYFGAVTIEQAKDVYVFHWLTGAPTTGIGQRIGDNMVVGWAGEGGKVIGSTVYNIQHGPKLVGRWVSIPGNGRPNFETLEFLKGFPSVEE